MGNLRSVEKALEHLGVDCRIQDDLKGADKLIIPGVGAFPAAMERLAPLSDEIRRFASDGGPLLGICLGQQLLFESSCEVEETAGLGILAGSVKPLPKDGGLKVPHIGWSSLCVKQNDGLLAGIQDGEQVYFVHSFWTDCADPSDAASLTSHGVEFPSAVQRENVWGAQFHPEKSGDAGLKMLENFAKC